MQLRTQNLIFDVQMPEIRPREMLARITGASLDPKDRNRGVYFELRMRTIPAVVNRDPFRAFRVGITQSNMSTPQRTP